MQWGQGGCRGCSCYSEVAAATDSRSSCLDWTWWMVEAVGWVRCTICISINQNVFTPFCPSLFSTAMRARGRKHLFLARHISILRLWVSLLPVGQVASKAEVMAYFPLNYPSIPASHPPSLPWNRQVVSKRRQLSNKCKCVLERELSKEDNPISRSHVDSHKSDILLKKNLPNPYPNTLSTQHLQSEMGTWWHQGR